LTTQGEDEEGRSYSGRARAVNALRFTYRPNPGFTGTDTLVYGMADDRANTATVTIAVRPGPTSCSRTGSNSGAAAARARGDQRLATQRAISGSVARFPYMRMPTR